jgi:transcription elongation factor GreA
LLSSINLAQIPKDRAGLGSKLVIHDLDNGAELRYELVFPEVADLETGLISIASPIGKSLVGRRAGDEVIVRVPAGKKRYEILELVTIHGDTTES